MKPLSPIPLEIRLGILIEISEFDTPSATSVARNKMTELVTNWTNDGFPKSKYKAVPINDPIPEISKNSRSVNFAVKTPIKQCDSIDIKLRDAIRIPK